MNSMADEKMWQQLKETEWQKQEAEGGDVSVNPSDCLE